MTLPAKTVALRLFAGTVIFLLRLVRGVCGLGVVFTGFTLIFLVSGIVPIPGKLTSLGGLVLVAVAMLVGVFLGLARLINRIHLGVYGTGHPVFSQRSWSL